jgi:Uma2 family endonuclease
VPSGRTGKRLDLPVVLVAELVSPGSRTNDNVTKRATYAEAGIPHYWLLDTRADRHRFEALRLDDGGAYATVLDTTGAIDIDDPLALHTTVAALFRPGGS